MRIGIIGLGLIGGSIAKTLKKFRGQHSHIIGYDESSYFTSKALEEHSIDEIATNLSTSFSNCNVIFICTPVSFIVPIATNLLSHVANDCIITDIGSTKEAIVTEINDVIQETNKKAYFIGGHPMTGSEKSGYFASTDFLFENAYYILTPSKGTPEFILFIMQRLIERLGAIPLIMSSNDHDFATSVVSHFPHIIASSLVHLVKDCDDETGVLHTLAAGGFKDITRIASSNPDVWVDICLSNKVKIQETFTRFSSLLQDFNEALSISDTTKLHSFFAEGKHYRDTFSDASNSSISKIYTIHVDAEDEPGIIACLATLLSSRGINIKDMGVINHREFESGVLRIAFASQADMLHAQKLLTKHNYQFYTHS